MTSTHTLSFVDKNNNAGLYPRLLIDSLVATIVVYLLNNIATFWFDSPGVLNLFAHNGWFDLRPDAENYSAGEVAIAWVQLLLYFLAIAIVVLNVRKSPGLKGLKLDTQRFSWVAAYIIRAAFWAVVLVGLADYIISFLRVENLLPMVVSDDLAGQLGVPKFRGIYVHAPLIVLSFIIAAFTRSLSFVWLAVLVVFAEFQIVISRFVFSYEQAFMGDIVRFWYAGLFLFASSYALVSEGHVRVDVLYAHLSRRAKAWSNVFGCILLGLPICFTILVLGLWGRGSSLNGPLLSFEISQSGYGMYVKYLMAAFLIVFALSMIFQFASYFLSNVAVLLSDDSSDTESLSE
jgi:TRAP-type mannitol/chloroaromatic compound transport system permease small subunit